MFGTLHINVKKIFVRHIVMIGMPHGGKVKDPVHALGNADKTVFVPDIRFKEFDVVVRQQRPCFVNVPDKTPAEMA